MAELHVEPKKHASGFNWIWIVVALLIVAAVVYFLTRNNNTNHSTGNGNTTGATSWVTTQQLSQAA